MDGSNAQVTVFLMGHNLAVPEMLVVEKTRYGLKCRKGASSIDEWAARDPTFAEAIPLDNCSQGTVGTVAASESEIFGCVEKYNVVIITSETGSGKTTTVPLILSRSWADTKILVVMPTKLNTEAVGRYVKSVNSKYSRLISWVHADRRDMLSGSNIVYCTTGIAINILNRPHKLTHLLVDEFHVMSLDIQTILEGTKHDVESNELKLVLMSATVDEDLHDMVNRYYDCRVHSLRLGSKRPYNIKYFMSSTRGLKVVNPSPSDAAYIRTHANNFDLISELDLKELAAVIVKQAKEGSVLVFLDGIGTIERLYRRLQYDCQSNVVVLHGQFGRIEMGKHVPGRNELYLSTDVAETGITLPKIQCVIDTGRRKVRNPYNAAGVYKLSMIPGDSSTVSQRSGRTGRDCDGKVIFFYDLRALKFMRENKNVEKLSRADLETFLRGRVAGSKMPTFHFMETLDSATLYEVKKCLQRFGYITECGTVTELGELAGAINCVEPNLAILVLLGIFFGLSEYMVKLAAILSCRNQLFANDRGESEIQKLRNLNPRGVQSRHVELVLAFDDAVSKRSTRQYNAVAIQQVLNAVQRIKSALSHWGICHCVDNPRFVNPHFRDAAVTTIISCALGGRTWISGKDDVHENGKSVEQKGIQVGTKTHFCKLGLIGVYHNLNGSPGCPFNSGYITFVNATSFCYFGNIGTSGTSVIGDCCTLGLNSTTNLMKFAFADAGDMNRATVFRQYLLQTFNASVRKLSDGKQPINIENMIAFAVTTANVHLNLNALQSRGCN